MRRPGSQGRGGGGGTLVYTLRGLPDGNHNIVGLRAEEGDVVESDVLGGVGIAWEHAFPVDGDHFLGLGALVLGLHAHPEGPALPPVGHPHQVVGDDLPVCRLGRAPRSLGTAPRVDLQAKHPRPHLAELTPVQAPKIVVAKDKDEHGADGDRYEVGEHARGAFIARVPRWACLECLALASSVDKLVGRWASCCTSSPLIGHAAPLRPRDRRQRSEDECNDDGARRALSPTRHLPPRRPVATGAAGD
mmetsp:Transcript_29206/g.74024  ORF Transcript_29206/g.74024 Transcript_29206/m.74024 type:complete len:247 (-) Transcript_29206:280-1020(-)